MNGKRTQSSQGSVWDRRLAKLTDLVEDRDWPYSRATTYRMVERGDIPTRRIGSNIVVIMPELIAQLHLEQAA